MAPRIFFFLGRLLQSLSDHEVTRSEPRRNYRSLCFQHFWCPSERNRFRQQNPLHCVATAEPEEVEEAESRERRKKDIQKEENRVIRGAHNERQPANIPQRDHESGPDEAHQLVSCRLETTEEAHPRLRYLTAIPHRREERLRVVARAQPKASKPQPQQSQSRAKSRDTRAAALTDSISTFDFGFDLDLISILVGDSAQTSPSRRLPISKHTIA